MIVGIGDTVRVKKLGKYEGREGKVHLVTPMKRPYTVQLWVDGAYVYVNLTDQEIEVLP